MGFDLPADPRLSHERMPLRPPMWIVSLAVHAILLAVFAWSLEDYGGPGTDLNTDGDYTEVGLFPRPVAAREFEDQTQQETSTESTDQPTDALSETTPSERSFQPDTPSDAPPIATPSKLLTNKTVGPSASREQPSAFRPPGTATDLQPGPVRTPVAPAPVGANRVNFFGIQSSGDRIVYLIDCSSSMRQTDPLGRRKMDLAREELIRSLEQLDDSQEFQVIFYNRFAKPLRIPGSEVKGGFYRAYRQTVNKAKREIKNLEPSEATRHMPALLAGLNLAPDLIFLLTDGEAELSRGDLETIKRTHREVTKKRTRINCVQFGVDADAGTNRFLEDIADFTEGRYRFRDLLTESRRR